MLGALFLVVSVLGGARAAVDPKLGYITADDSEFEGQEGDFFKFVSVGGDHRSEEAMHDC